MGTGVALSTRQRQMIFALARQAGMDQDVLHDVVRRVSGQEHITNLSRSDGIRVIDSLRAATGQGTPLGWLTAGQRGKIYALCRELGWVTANGQIDMARLEGFVRARCGIDRLAWVPMGRARSIIEALKAMAAGGRGERRTGT